MAALLAATAIAAPPTYTSAAAVTPSDSTDLPNAPAYAIYVGVTGTLTVVMYNGATVQFTAVPAGTTIPIKVTRVKATGTGASSIVAFF